MDKTSSYRNDVQAILSSRAFCSCVFLVVLLAFGFATFNMSVSRDDLQGYIYTGIGQNMLASGRFTIFLIDHLTSSTVRGPAVAYINDILAILGLVWAAINFCIFFRRVCGNALSTAACTIFTCIFVSYPLITELWEYIGAYRVVAFGYLCDSFALLLMYDLLHGKASGGWKSILISCLLMMLVCAGYESLVPVYIFCVFAILALQVVYGTPKEKRLPEIIRQGLCYAGVLIVGLILRVVVHQLILSVLHLAPEINGSTEFHWGRVPFRKTLVNTLVNLLHKYILRAIVYFPLTELVIAGLLLLVIGIVLASRHGWSLLLPGMGMYISLIILSLVQGAVSGYRSCQVFAIFVAFTAMFLVMLAEKANKLWLRISVLFLCGYLCFQQADQTNYLLTLNYLRSEEEAAVIQDIGTDLRAQFDRDKPVIFVGDYVLSNELIEAASIPENSWRWKMYKKAHEYLSTIIVPTNFELSSLNRKLLETNVNSYISFGLWSFSASQEPLQRLFEFYGFDYIRPDCIALYPEAKSYVQEHQIPCYPADGYIQDTDEYVIVHIR